MDLQPQAEVIFSYRKESNMNLTTIKSYEDLPLTLNASQIANILGISKSCAYTLLHRADFPTVQIGRRMIVSKAKFEHWLESQDCRSERVDK
jgi:excisionase family DNA binding protein